MTLEFVEVSNTIYDVEETSILISHCFPIILWDLHLQSSVPAHDPSPLHTVGSLLSLPKHAAYVGELVVLVVNKVVVGDTVGVEVVLVAADVVVVALVVVVMVVVGVFVAVVTVGVGVSVVGAAVDVVGPTVVVSMLEVVGGEVQVVGSAVVVGTIVVVGVSVCVEVSIVVVGAGVGESVGVGVLVFLVLSVMSTCVDIRDNDTLICFPGDTSNEVIYVGARTTILCPKPSS